MGKRSKINSATHKNSKLLWVAELFIEQCMQREAENVLKQLNFSDDNLPHAIALYQQGWHQRVIGIVAGRLKEKYHRPCVVFAAGKDDSSDTDAAIGNLGVGLNQWLVPFVLAVSLGGMLNLQSFTLTNDIVIQPQIIPLLLLALVLMSTLLAYLDMNNIKITGTSLKKQSKIFSNKHCWIMSVLYTFTFIGFSAILPMIFVTVFNNYDFALTAIAGGTLSSAIRPLSNYLAIYTGAVRLTKLSFIIMILGSSLMLFSIPSTSAGGSFSLFVSAYMIIFVGTGLGKGSTTSMIPEIFKYRH